MTFYWSNRIRILLISILLTIIVIIGIMNIEVFILNNDIPLKGKMINVLLLMVFIFVSLYGYFITFGICKLTITDDEIINTKFMFYHVKMKRDNIKYAEIDEVKSFFTIKKIVRVYGKNNEYLYLPNFSKNAKTITDILDKPLTITSYYE